MKEKIKDLITILVIIYVTLAGMGLLPEVLDVFNLYG